MLNEQQIEMLNAPLDGGVVSQRNQAGMTLSYVEGHYCIRRANTIFGFGNWKRRTIYNSAVSIEDVTNEKSGKSGWRVAYVAEVEFSVRVGEEWVPMTGTGFGESTSYISPGQAHEGACKEAETDAMKRAMICWGDQFGLALYSKAQEHVEGAVAAAPRQSSGGNGQGRQQAPQGGGNGPAGTCPDCGKPMYERQRKDGSGSFYGCSNYPACKKTFQIGKAPWDQQARAQGPAPVEPGDDDPFGGSEGGGAGSSLLHVVTDKSSFTRFCMSVGANTREEILSLYKRASERAWQATISEEALRPEHWQQLHDTAMDILLEEAEAKTA